MLVMGLVLGQCLMLISSTGILLYAKVCPLYNVLWDCIVVVYTLTTLFTKICEVSYTYLLGFLRY